MANEPDNLVSFHLRELREGQVKLDRKLDAVLEALHDMRTEAAADRSRFVSLDTTVQTLGRPLRTDERLGDLAKRVDTIMDSEPGGQNRW